jgi:hypothetical protein
MNLYSRSSLYEVHGASFHGTRKPSLLQPRRASDLCFPLVLEQVWHISIEAGSMQSCRKLMVCCLPSKKAGALIDLHKLIGYFSWQFPVVPGTLEHIRLEVACRSGNSMFFRGNI